MTDKKPRASERFADCISIVPIFVFFIERCARDFANFILKEIFWRWRFAKDFFLFGFKFERVETKNANATILASFQKKNQCQSVSKSDGTQLRVWLLRQSNRSPLPYYFFNCKILTVKCLWKKVKKLFDFLDTIDATHNMSCCPNSTLILLYFGNF